MQCKSVHISTSPVVFLHYLPTMLMSPISHLKINILVFHVKNSPDTSQMTNNNQWNIVMSGQYSLLSFMPGSTNNKKAQLSLTNPRDAKACQKLLQFDVLTTLTLTILAYLHSFSCCCVQNLRNPAKFTENSNLWSSRSSILVSIESPCTTSY